MPIPSTSVVPQPERGLARAKHRAALTAIVCLAAWVPPVAGARTGQTEVLDAKALPLGDGRVSTEAKRGHVFACATQFRGGGARHAGDWIQGSTWEATRKIWVQGEVLWPEARFSIEMTDTQRVLTGNALPVGHATGRFPIERSDPAFQIDRNPNPILAQTLTFALPLQPVVADQASCAPMGTSGVALNGVPIFNALDDAGRDAVAHEVQDRCHGHPQSHGIYHYHGPSDCVPGNTENNVLVGYALDSFGIYSGPDDVGREITNADLDECHGRVGRVMWNGQLATMYHYVMTREYPYTLGCFRGTPVSGRSQGARGAAGPNGDARPARRLRQSGPPP